MIPRSEYQKIRNIDVNDHKVKANFPIWLKNFINHPTLYGRIELIQDYLGSEFSRENLVNFYREKNIDSPIKFIAAMIWGYEAPMDGRRAGYGPARVKAMFENLDAADNAICTVNVDTIQNIESSYKTLSNKNVLRQCGPNFFTKYFYFLGKSKNLKNYPVIFDDRVANSLFALSINNPLVSEMISVATIRSPKAYSSFLSFINMQCLEIGCEPDQLELYLFSKAK